MPCRCVARVIAWYKLDRMQWNRACGLSQLQAGREMAAILRENVTAHSTRPLGGLASTSGRLLSSSAITERAASSPLIMQRCVRVIVMKTLACAIAQRALPTDGSLRRSVHYQVD